MIDSLVAAPSVLRIGDYRVEPALDEISRNGRVTKLEPRAMGLLLCLARHAGEVVSVDRLLEEVWGDVVVSPDTVYQVVTRLRRALDDDAKAPSYIANVVRRGYRLIAPVSAWDVRVASSPNVAETMGADGNRVAPINDPPAAPPPERRVADASIGTTDPRRHRHHRWRIVGALAALVAVAAVVLRSGYIDRWPLGEASGGATPRSTPDSASVAVLPFLDLSQQHDQGYFADGISEELIDLLSRDQRIRVPARTSSFYFKGRQATIAEMARALAVSYLLEGSVRKSGETVRITAQLIRADTGFHVWSQTYEGPVADVFKTQDEIAAAVVSSLTLSLTVPWAAKVPGSVNSAAYTLYLKGRNLATGNSTADFEQARKYLEQALVLDPNFALGWATLAEVETDDLNWHGSANIPASCAQARGPIAEALRLDPLLPEAHRMLARQRMICEVDPAAAELELNQSLKLDPQGTLLQMATFLATTNRPRRGLEFALRAVSADPLNSWAHVVTAFAQGDLGRLTQAESEYRTALGISPSAAGLHVLLANALLAQGRIEEAAVENEREGDEEFRMMNLPAILEARGQRDEAQRALDAYLSKYHDPYTAALFYACRREPDRAIAYLRELPAGYNLWDVPTRMGCLRSLDGDPRFAAIRAEHKLPPRQY